MKQDLGGLSHRPLTVGLRVSGLRVGNIKKHDSTVHDPDEKTKPVDPRAREFHDYFLFRSSFVPHYVLPAHNLRRSRRQPLPVPLPLPFRGND